jgi:hypothetical protein
MSRKLQNQRLKTKKNADKMKSGPFGPPFKKLITNCKLPTENCYLPAPAAAAAGIIPVMVMLSIRASTVARLAPVSVQAST